MTFATELNQMNLVYVHIKLKRTRFICTGDFETDNIIEILTSKILIISSNYFERYMIKFFNDKVDKHRGVFYTFITPKEAKTYPQRAVWLFAFNSK